jgi:hypothetical protein
MVVAGIKRFQDCRSPRLSLVTGKNTGKNSKQRENQDD